MYIHSYEDLSHCFDVYRLGKELGVDPEAILATSHGRRSIDTLALYDKTKANWECKQQPYVWRIGIHSNKKKTSAQLKVPYHESTGRMPPKYPEHAIFSNSWSTSTHPGQLSLPGLGHWSPAGSKSSSWHTPKTLSWLRTCSKANLTRNAISSVDPSSAAKLDSHQTRPICWWSRMLHLVSRQGKPLGSRSLLLRLHILFSSSRMRVRIGL